VAHIFFGTASAKIEDKGGYWEITGVPVVRDEEQVIWAVERLNPGKWERELFYSDSNLQWEKLHKFFSQPSLEQRKGRRQALKAEYDAALQIGTRGVDPLAKYEVLAPRSTGETKKKFKDFFQEVAAATLGRAFAARVESRTRRETYEVYILPVFRGRFVLSGFLDYGRYFSHSAGGWVAAAFAALSILLDLTTKLPVTDFAYTQEVKGPTRQPIFSRSGYLGLEQLCMTWWQAVQENNTNILALLMDTRDFLRQTSVSAIDEQVLSLARWVAEFVASPNIDALTMIERLKARIRAVSQRENIPGTFAVNLFLGRTKPIRGVREVVEAHMQARLPEVPWQVSEALAKALAFDERGWMNQFTRLENAPNFTVFLQQLEHIISRGYYREQQEKGQPPDIRRSLTDARDLAVKLREASGMLQDEKMFRAWKAMFLLDVLSRARFGRVSHEHS